MKIDSGLLVTDMKQIPARVRELEEAGFDGCFTFEGPHEPFMPLVLAAEHSKLEVGTGTCNRVCAHPDDGRPFGPRLAAILGWPVLARPRFSDQAAHRGALSMPWSKPVTRMKEFVRALRAILANWNTNEKLDFRGRVLQAHADAAHLQPGPAKGGVHLDLSRRRRAEDDRGSRRGGRRHAAASVPHRAIAPRSDAAQPAERSGGLRTPTVRLHAVRAGAPGDRGTTKRSLRTRGR